MSIKSKKRFSHAPKATTTHPSFLHTASVGDDRNDPNPRVVNSRCGAVDCTMPGADHQNAETLSRTVPTQEGATPNDNTSSHETPPIHMLPIESESAITSRPRRTSGWRPPRTHLGAHGPGRTNHGSFADKPHSSNHKNNQQRTSKRQ